MNRQSFKSSNIVSAGYDAESKVIEVEFVGGAVWRYHAVPVSVWESLCTAPSVGSFVAKHLKAGYAGAKVDVETKKT